MDLLKVPLDRGLSNAGEGAHLWDKGPMLFSLHKITSYSSTNLALLSQHCAVFPAHVLVEVSPEGSDIFTMIALVFLDLKRDKL